MKHGPFVATSIAIGLACYLMGILCASLTPEIQATHGILACAVAGALAFFAAEM